MKDLLKKFYESFLAVLPITVLVIILAWVATDISGEMIGLFAVGSLLIIIGMTLFTLGADIAMMPIGSSLGSYITKHKKLVFAIVVCLVIGIIITIAEPDLQVLSEQLNSKVILYSVAIGVGIFLVISLLRTFFKIKLHYILLAFYTLIFILAIFVPKNYLAIAFDSGGVTTGPMTVPFLMSFGIGLAAVRGGESNHDDSFGVIALCSVGPILAVMIVGLTNTTQLSYTVANIPAISSLADILLAFLYGIPYFLKEVSIALIPIALVFFAFQIFVLKLPKTQVIRICIGILYTFIGLTLFLTGVNVGFMPMGSSIGNAIASSAYRWILIPCGMLMGCFIVLAEPAVHVLTTQVEKITGGSISRKSMLISLAIGISFSIGLAMLRVLTGISIWYFIAPVYVISLILTFFVPTIFTGIAFDSGGVASGPMTATFILPLAIGASTALNGNVYTDAFGLVAFVAMTPLITIQLLGLVYTFKAKAHNAKTKIAVETPLSNTDTLLEFDEQPIEFGEDYETEVISIEKESIGKIVIPIEDTIIIEEKVIDNNEDNSNTKK